MSDVNENQTAPPAPTKKRGKLPLIIIALAVMLTAGGGAYFFLFRSSAAAARDRKAKAEEPAAADENDAGENGEGESGEGAESAGGGGKSEKAGKLSLPRDESVKTVVELQPFIVNLADTEEARYLRLTVSLGIGSAEKPDALFTTRVRNALLAVLTTKHSDEILSVEGKNLLRKELLRASKAASREPEVEAIYITDFIIQL